MQVASTLLALLIGLAPWAPKTTSVATVARLEVTITTSSDRTSVEISPGRIAAMRLVSVPADVMGSASASGWSMRSPAGVARTVRLTAVLEEPRLASTMRVTLTKGSVGTASVDIVNTSRAPFRAALVVNRLSGSGEADPRTSVYRNRYQFFGSVNPQLVRADPVRRTLAFYYPWFTRRSYNDPTLADRPSQRLGTIGANDVLQLTRMAREGGIGGFIVSWAGADWNGTAFTNVLRAAEQTAGVATVLVETPGANAGHDRDKPSDPAVVLQWIREALASAESPAFLRSGGVPVVFVYEMTRLSPDGWLWVTRRLAEAGQRVRLVGDAPLGRYGSVAWGIYRYSVNDTPPALWRWNRDTMYDARLLRTNDPTGPHLFAATVAPGYDDRNLRGDDRPVIERGPAGGRYAATWETALSSQPDWVLATSWNEWFEGTSVQPSELFGDLALKQTAEFARRFAG